MCWVGGTAAAGLSKALGVAFVVVYSSPVGVTVPPYLVSHCHELVVTLGQLFSSHSFSSLHAAITLLQMGILPRQKE